ncbi:MAG: hypothetical protein AAGE43_09975 [Pseudomonadota bacterium]
MSQSSSNTEANGKGAGTRSLVTPKRAAWQGWRSFSEAAPAAYLTATGECWAELTEADFEQVSVDWIAAWERLTAEEQGPSTADLRLTLRGAETPADRLVAYAAALQVVGTETVGSRALLTDAAEQLGVQGLLRRHVDGASRRLAPRRAA